jgi:hypothetical protein
VPLIDCPHAEDVGKQSTARCKLGRFGGEPHIGVCRSRCEFGKTPGTVEPDRAYVAERMALCDACGWGCGLGNLNACGRKARLARPNLHCPREHF